METFKRRKLDPSGSSKDANADHLKPWVEKYRPSDLSEVTGQNHAVKVLKKTLASANLPHMLFYGPPGTGKTSTMLALTRELFGPELMKSRVLELNASDERGISIVREKIKNFARLTVSKPTNKQLEEFPCPPYKIIILDEADSMTADAQSALRRTMETYSNVTRFCLICNYITRIIDPLASRCSKFRFRSLNSTNAISRLKYISDTEKIVCDDKVLRKILDISQGDLRKAITLLQSSSRLNLDNGKPLTVTQIEELAGLVPDDKLTELVNIVATNKLDNIIKFVDSFMKEGWSATSTIEQLHDFYISHEEFDTTFKNKVSWVLFETDSKLTNGTNERIQLLNALVKISKLY